MHGTSWKADRPKYFRRFFFSDFEIRSVMCSEILRPYDNIGFSFESTAFGVRRVTLYSVAAKPSQQEVWLMNIRVCLVFN